LRAGGGGRWVMKRVENTRFGENWPNVDIHWEKRRLQDLGGSPLRAPNEA
jgi:hypothetical protein